MTAAVHVPAAALAVSGEGRAAIIGASVSFTVTLKVAVDVLAPSLAVRVTNVVPTGKNEPLGKSAVTVALEQVSVAVTAAQLTVAPHWPRLLPVVMSAGTPTKVGASPSTIVTVKLDELMFPAGSVAV